MKKIVASLILMTVVLCSHAARAGSLTLAVPSDRVDISTGFDGASITVFGMTESHEPNIIITLKGPEPKTIMRRKDQVLGAWMLTDSIEFRRVPAYYDFALSEIDMAQIPKAVLQEHEVGIDNLGFYAEDDEEDSIIAPYREALIRQKQQQGFFPLKPRSIEIIREGFFKARFDLPADVPTGAYTIQGVLLNPEFEVVAQDTKTIHVGQVGFNARVYRFAHEGSAGYALFIILIAAASGWAAFTFLRRE
jgi:uncharacterized protein (TIGR02186 family)